MGRQFCLVFINKIIVHWRHNYSVFCRVQLLEIFSIYMFLIPFEDKICRLDMYFILNFFIILYVKFNVSYILYVTIKFFLVCHTVSFLETNVPVLGETNGDWGRSAFYGEKFRSKIIPSKCLQKHVPF